MLEGLQAGTDLRLRPRDRALSVMIAVAIHALFFLGILAAGSGALTRGAQAQLGEGEAVEVSFSGWEGLAARRASGTTASATQQTQLDRMVERLRAVNSPLYVVEEPRPVAGGGLASLFDAPAAQSGKGRQGEGRDAVGQQNEAGVGAKTAFSSLIGDGADGGSAAGGLWRRIEPCWSRLPRRSDVPVTLEISLTGNGRLAKPPRILRPGVSRPDEQRLIAEARALEAISACLPYSDAQGLGRTQTVSFPGSRAR